MKRGDGEYCVHHTTLGNPGAHLQLSLSWGRKRYLGGKKVGWTETRSESPSYRGMTCMVAQDPTSNGSTMA